jgi:chloramphenicol 3-O phosphotransferase
VGPDDVARPGPVVILNGAPRSGKSSIARALGERGDGVWVTLGVDVSRAMTPERPQPGIGLRPGGERPDLEPAVVLLWQALYASVAAHARRGIGVAVDALHHDDFSRPLGVLDHCLPLLDGVPVLLVGVRCPLDVVRERRRTTWGGAGFAPSEVTQDPVARWDAAVHRGIDDDLEVDTSALDPSACADSVLAALASRHGAGR